MHAHSHYIQNKFREAALNLLCISIKHSVEQQNKINSTITTTHLDVKSHEKLLAHLHKTTMRKSKFMARHSNCENSEWKTEEDASRILKTQVSLRCT